MAAATPNIMPCAVELKGEAGGLEWKVCPLPLTQGRSSPGAPLPSVLPLTSYWPELGHTPTHRPGASPTFFAIQGSLPKILSGFF